MEEKVVKTTNELVVDNYKLHINGKSTTDAALSVFWSLYAETVGLYTTFLKANIPEITVGGTKSVSIDDRRPGERVIKIAKFEGPSFRLIVKGYLPNGVKIAKPMILFGDEEAKNLDIDTLSYAGDLCRKFYEAACQYLKPKGLVIAEAELELIFDEYGALYFTGEILTPNKATYWLLRELKTATYPMPFHSQPAINFLMECKAGRQTYNRSVMDAVKNDIANKYASLCRYIVGPDWRG